MPLVIHNTLTRKKETFQPLAPDKITMYSCGPTVYNYIHIGNARTFMMADMIRRYLQYRGFSVRFVTNVTDIDDRIIQTANATGRDFMEINKTYTDAFIEDIARAGVKPPEVLPKVTDHVPEIIAIIQILIQKGFAYESDGSIYYDVKKFTTYGNLSGKNIDDLKSGARVEVNETKRDPLDFVLWKSSKPGEPSWESPWGKGRPGWHIECSAMCIKHLGEEIDIHIGGADLIFPHHENEIAQSEGASGKQFARYWMHCGFLNVNNEKMSKSLGNFWLLRDVLEKFRPEVLRLFFIQHHYASPLNFSEQNLRDTETAHRRLENTFSRLEEAIKEKPIAASSVGLEAFEKEFDRLVVEFDEAMEDDFNTAGASGKVFEIFSGLNRFLGKPTDEKGQRILKKISDQLLAWNEFFGFLHLTKAGTASGDIAPFMELLIEIRREMRKKKDFAMSDLIRDRLSELNIVIEDTPQGTKWKSQ